MAESPKCLIEAYIDLLRVMECPVCYEYGSSNTAFMVLCQEGHLVCDSCSLKVKKCPLCDQPFSGIRTTIFNQIREAMIYPCRKVGCGMMMGLNDLYAHEQCCDCREEEPSDFENNTVIIHNIHKHIEDNFSSFYRSPQNKVAELGLCIECLCLIDDNLAPTAAPKQDINTHSSNNKNRNGLSNNMEDDFVASIDAIPMSSTNNKVDLNAPSTSQERNQGSESLKSLKCNSSEEATGFVDTVDGNACSKPQKELNSADVLASKQIHIHLLKCLIRYHISKDKCKKFYISK